MPSKPMAVYLPIELHKQFTLEAKKLGITATSYGKILFMLGHDRLINDPACIGSVIAGGLVE